MATGTCRLCLTEDIEIRDSHLLPKNFYKATHGPGENPVYLRSDRTRETSKQTTAPLLADCCEQRFSGRGESWAALNLWRDTGFPLRDALAQVAGPEVKRFRECDAAAAGVDVNQLVCLGASIFWRAGVHHWKLPEAPARLINLGRYEDALRRFLLDQQPFPVEMVLMATVNTGARASGVIGLPRGGRCPEGFHVYFFDGPGITYGLAVGKEIPRFYYQMCVATRGVVALSDRVDDWRIDAATKMFRETTIIGKLAKDSTWRPCRN